MHIRYATILLALLFSSADALAQDPLDTALRDAQRLAQCAMALDAPCVIALSDIHSYQLLSTTAFDFAKAQTHFYDALRDRGWGWIRYDVTAPREVFQDGTRLYAFVPYIRTSTFGGQLHTTQGFDVALSVDGGETWKFVGIEPRHPNGYASSFRATPASLCPQLARSNQPTVNEGPGRSSACGQVMSEAMRSVWRRGCRDSERLSALDGTTGSVSSLDVSGCGSGVGGTCRLRSSSGILCWC